MLGGLLTEKLRAAGHDVVVSTRQKGRPSALPEDVRSIHWDTTHVPDWIEPFDAVINVAGKSLIDQYWTEGVKKELWRSRADVNQYLTKWIRVQKDPPSVFITASAVGIYGGHPSGPVDEGAALGDDFLARLCKAWEEAAFGAASEQTRVVATRFGIMLDPQEGALAKMALPFKLYLGGKIGNGRQPFPWVTTRDAARAILRALEGKGFRGAVNVVAPDPVDNAGFTRALGEALHRPTPWIIPPMALKVRYGEGADILSEGQEVVPRRLTEIGFEWEDPALLPALQRLVDGGRRT